MFESTLENIIAEWFFQMMIDYPDIEQGDKAGVFIILKLGIFYRQDQLALGIFSGLRLHIGDSPTSSNPSPASL